MKRSLLVGTVVGLISACGVRPGSAEVQVEPPRQPGGEITQEHAEELYRGGHYAEAAWILEHLLEHPPTPRPYPESPLPPQGCLGEIESTSFEPPRAEFWLAKARFQLGDHAGSLSLFLRIAADPNHHYHLLTLPWLASLTRKLPDSPEPLQAIARYPPESLDDEAFDSVRDELQLLMGRWHVHYGDVASGRSLLAQVPPDSDYALLARFELGELLWSEGRIDEAIVHHREVLVLWSRQVEEYQALSRSRRRLDPLVEPPECERSRQRLRSQGFSVGEPPDLRRRARRR